VDKKAHPYCVLRILIAYPHRVSLLLTLTAYPYCSPRIAYPYCVLRTAYPYCVPLPHTAIAYPHCLPLPHTAYHHRVPALLTAYPYPSLRIPTVHPHHASLRRTAHCSLCIHTVHCSLRILIAYCVSLRCTAHCALHIHTVHCPLRTAHPHCLPLLLTIKTPGTLLTAYPYHISLT